MTVCAAQLVATKTLNPKDLNLQKKLNLTHDEGKMLLQIYEQLVNKILFVFIFFIAVRCSLYKHMAYVHKNKVLCMVISFLFLPI